MEDCPWGVTVIMDHQPLARLMDQPVLTRVQTRWLRLGLFQSICPTIKYQIGKANVVADALSRSQRNTAENSTVELAKNNLDSEVYALTSITIEPSEEDLKIWHQGYLEDLSIKTVFQQLPPVKIGPFYPWGKIGVKRVRKY